jgi:hypothetical protein
MALQAALSALDADFASGLITKTEKSQIRLKIISQAHLPTSTSSVASAPATPMPSTSSIEDSGTKAQRETLSAVKALIGDSSAPTISGALRLALTTGTPDETLRKDLTRFTTGSEFRRRLRSEFLEQAKDGQTPNSLVGTTETHVWLRHAVHDQLLKLAISFLASQAVVANPAADRVAIANTLDRTLRDEGSMLTGLTVLSAVTSINKVTGPASSATPITSNTSTNNTTRPSNTGVGGKRKRETKKVLANPSQKCTNCGGRGHASCELPKSVNLTCSLCQGKGHISPQCPSPVK